MNMANHQARAVPSAADLRWTWSGAFQSRHPEVAPFTVTVTIDQDDQGHMMGKLSHSSECLQEVDLHITVYGSKVSLAGSDQKGNSITFQGKMDKSYNLLSLHYIINGSAGGKCESDDGSGTFLNR